MTRTFYFHGCPGAASELTLFSGVAPPPWTVADRTIAEEGSPEEYLRQLSAQVGTVARERPVRLVGFSLGAFVALEVASRLPGLPVTLDLVSAAAPLQLGDFLPHMAGKPVFATAIRSPAAFDALTAVQGAVASIMPALLMRSVFADPRGDDAGLVADAQFRTGMRHVLWEGFGAGRSAYRRDVKAYVTDWSPVLDRIRHPVTLWHGTADNWTPPAMAHALAERLPQGAEVNWVPEGSHFSTLRHFMRHDAGSIRQ